MLISSVLNQILDYRELHGVFPERAYTSVATAQSLLNDSMALFDAGSQDGALFGRTSLGVAEWYIDNGVVDDEIRFERGDHAQVP